MKKIGDKLIKNENSDITTKNIHKYLVIERGLGYSDLFWMLNFIK